MARSAPGPHPASARLVIRQHQTMVFPAAKNL